MTPRLETWKRAGHRQIVTEHGDLIAEVFSGAVGNAQADLHECMIAATPLLVMALSGLLDQIECAPHSHVFRTADAYSALLAAQGNALENAKP